MRFEASDLHTTSIFITFETLVSTSEIQLNEVYYQERRYVKRNFGDQEIILGILLRIPEKVCRMKLRSMVQSKFQKVW